MRTRLRRRSLLVRVFWTVSTVGLTLLTAWEFEWPPFHNGKIKLPFLSKSKPVENADAPAKEPVDVALDTHIQHKPDLADHAAQFPADEGAFLASRSPRFGIAIVATASRILATMGARSRCRHAGAIYHRRQRPGQRCARRAADDEFAKSFHINSSDPARANSFDGGEWKSLPPAPTHVTAKPRDRTNGNDVIQASGQRTDHPDDFQPLPGGKSNGVADQNRDVRDSSVTIDSGSPDFDVPNAHSQVTKRAQ